MAVSERAETLKAALARLNQCADLLEPLSDDPQVRFWLSEIEGTDGGWFNLNQDEPEFLADQIQIQLLRERGQAN